jgi:beta-glucosidase
MISLAIPLFVYATSVFAAAGDGDWASAYSKAATALAQLSNTDKVGLATGLGWQKGGCVGNVAAIESIGFPELCLQDGPLGYVLKYSSHRVY